MERNRRVWLVLQNAYGACCVRSVCERREDAVVKAGELAAIQQATKPFGVWHRYDVVDMDVMPRDPDNDGVTSAGDLPPAAKARIDARMKERMQEYERLRERLEKECAAYTGVVSVCSKIADLRSALCVYDVSVDEYKVTIEVLQMERSVLREALYEFFAASRIYPGIRDRSEIHQAVEDFFRKMHPGIVSDFCAFS